jgi:MFS family permease
MLLTWGLTGFLGPVAGALGDRFDRRRVMIVSEAAAAGCWIALAFMARSPAPLLGLAFIASILESPFFPASSAAIPNVASVEHLSWANSLIAIGRNTGLTVGPLLGGLGVATLGGRWVFLANAASYLVSVLLSWSVGLSFEDREGPAEAADEHRGMIAGFRFVMRDRVLRQMAIAWFIFLLGMASTLIADPPLAKAFGAGSIGYGMITTAWGGGTILGSFLARRMTEQSEGWWLVLASAVVALTGFGVALSPWFWMVLVWVALFGIADGPTLVAEQNLL